MIGYLCLSIPNLVFQSIDRHNMYLLYKISVILQDIFTKKLTNNQAGNPLDSLPDHYR